MTLIDRWRCGFPAGCDTTIFGVGSPHGLRAIGWEVILCRDGLHLLRCPVHHGDSDVALTNDAERLHKAYQRARRIQEAIATPFDRSALRKKVHSFSKWRLE